MKRLIIANTYYQVIFAIQMKLTIFKKDYVDIIITDHSRNADYFSNKLKECKCFENVYYVNTLGSGDRRNKFQKVWDILSFSFGTKNRFNFFVQDIKQPYYDEMLVFNYDMRTYGIFSVLSRYNSKINLSRYEEGILTYNSEKLFTPARKVVGLMRKMQNKAVIENSFSNFYCFYPELYDGVFSVKRVPLIEGENKIKDILSVMFDINKKNMAYSQKYIFFTSVLDFEGGEPVGEYELVCKIAKLVGKENLLIKIHPRDKRTIYTDNNFCVDKNSCIPWEAIQLSGNFSDKVFMTVNSGSVLSGSTMSKNAVRTYFMFKLCNVNNNDLGKKSVYDINRLLSQKSMKKLLNKVKIAERLEDIL